jgi:hypothetical protein
VTVPQGSCDDNSQLRGCHRQPRFSEYAEGINSQALSWSGLTFYSLQGSLPILRIAWPFHKRAIREFKLAMRRALNDMASIGQQRRLLACSHEVCFTSVFRH